MDYMNFKTPYSRWDKVRRLLWTIVWGVCDRPLPKSMGRKWKITTEMKHYAYLVSVVAMKKVEPWTVVGGNTTKYIGNLQISHIYDKKK